MKEGEPRDSNSTTNRYATTKPLRDSSDEKEGKNTSQDFEESGSGGNNNMHESKSEESDVEGSKKSKTLSKAFF